MIEEDHDQTLSTLIYLYGSLYGPQIVLLATLSAITVFRREISCNHVYAEEEHQQQQSKSNENRASYKWNEQQADELLNGAGLYCSGSSLLPPVVSLMSLLGSQQDLDSGVHEPKKGAFSLPANVSTGDLLELAGNYYCGEPMVKSLLLNQPMHVPKTLSPYKRTQVEQPEKETHIDLLGLPTDVWIQIFTFSNAEDVVSFGSANRACREFVDGKNNMGNSMHLHHSTNLLWKTLWKRDYGWLLQHWDVGTRAARRSLGKRNSPAEPPRFDKRVYFRFEICWCDYLLAGCNTFEECLVGIGGHIFDMSAFLFSHPGSPETVCVHAGQDATVFFSRIRHTKGARKLALSMCVVVDQARLGDGVGLRPTSVTQLMSPDETNQSLDRHPPRVSAPQEDQLKTLRPTATEPYGVGSRRRAPILASVAKSYEIERSKFQSTAERKFHKSDHLTQPKVYYDPLTLQWKAWYMDSQMNNVFVGSVQ